MIETQERWAAVDDYLAGLFVSGDPALVRPGTLIVADNVVRHGGVADESSTDANVQGVRRFLMALANEPRVSATVVQTVGQKGYDGWAVAVVKDAERGQNDRPDQR